MNKDKKYSYGGKEVTVKRDTQANIEGFEKLSKELQESDSVSSMFQLADYLVIYPEGVTAAGPDEKTLSEAKEIVGDFLSLLSKESGELFKSSIG
jgi:hypothetical protein